MKGFQFLGVGGNWSNGENLPRQVWNRQTKFTYNHWLAALVKGKFSSTKPTRLATRVVCHPDTEQNRFYEIPWPCWELNRGPTAQARSNIKSIGQTIKLKIYILTSLSGASKVSGANNGVGSRGPLKGPGGVQGAEPPEARRFWQFGRLSRGSYGTHFTTF